MDTLTLADALKLLIFPRVLGQLDNGEDLIVNKGPFGPYMKSGAVNVTLPPEFDPTEVTFEQAKTLFTEGAEKKRVMMAPLLELGEDPETKTPLMVKSGRYGAYVTDGKTNATVPKDQDPMTVTREQAIEMLVKKRKAPKRAWKGKKKDAAE
jgi:DNA topoisomerase-1